MCFPVNFEKNNFLTEHLWATAYDVKINDVNYSGANREVFFTGCYNELIMSVDYLI